MNVKRHVEFNYKTVRLAASYWFEPVRYNLSFEENTLGRGVEVHCEIAIGNGRAGIKDDGRDNALDASQGRTGQAIGE